MIPRLLNKTVKGDFVIIDSMFPQKEPFGFRNIEINEYLSRMDTAEAYSMSVMEPWGDAWFPWSYGVDEATYKKITAVILIAFLKMPVRFITLIPVKSIGSSWLTLTFLLRPMSYFLFMKRIIFPLYSCFIRAVHSD